MPLPVLVHQGLQRPSSASMFVDGDAQTGAGVFQPLGPSARQLHVRSVLKWCGFFWGSCSCGWLTTGCVTEDQAQTEACRVEIELADSAARRQRLYARG